eukprot:TRINITY_DN26680_c0_g2_i1.p1 TRINITY_DN26680_c0_g2~~TRINITY_DN26680_c0_g2_i1.p1  ORF type:complete len:552 (+),score=57.62 TRINITY_DN26680_c0_g2_i1:892-2547(+)
MEGAELYVEQHKKLNPKITSWAKVVSLEAAIRQYKKVKFMRDTAACKEKLYITDESIPVISLDFAATDLASHLARQLAVYVDPMRPELANEDPLALYKKLVEVKRLSVLLIDEYDVPVCSPLFAKDYAQMEKNLHLMSEFFMQVKALQKHVVFSLATGCTRLGRTGLLSPGNIYRDVSLQELAAEVCGFNHAEVEQLFKKHNVPHDSDSMKKIKHFYNGYTFTEFNPDGHRLCNPLAINSYITMWAQTKQLKLDYYWANDSTSKGLFVGSWEAVRKRFEAANALLSGTATTTIATMKQKGGPIDMLVKHPVFVLLDYGFATIGSIEKDQVKLKTPNEETNLYLRNELRDMLWGRLKNPAKRAKELGEAIIKGSVDEYLKVLGNIVKEFVAETSLVESLFEHTVQDIIATVHRPLREGIFKDIYIVDQPGLNYVDFGIAGPRFVAIMETKASFAGQKEKDGALKQAKGNKGRMVKVLEEARFDYREKKFYACAIIMDKEGGFAKVETEECQTKELTHQRLHPNYNSSVETMQCISVNACIDYYLFILFPFSQ